MLLCGVLKQIPTTFADAVDDGRKETAWDHVWEDDLIGFAHLIGNLDPTAKALCYVWTSHVIDLLKKAGPTTY